MRRVLILVAAVVVALPLVAAADTTVDKDALRKELAERRELNLKRFHAYRRARIYPHNSYEVGALNVWRDAEGHLCAVATMVFKDGFEALTLKTAEKDNFIKLADVTQGPLADWVLTSGFTQEELVMIQWPSRAEDMERERQEVAKAKRARAKEDRRLFAGYRTTEETLKQDRVREAGLDLAVARLAARPELIAKLHERTTRPIAKK